MLEFNLSDIDDNYSAIMKAVYIDLVKIMVDHDIPRAVALSIATDFIETMRDDLR